MSKNNFVWLLLIGFCLSIAVAVITVRQDRLKQTTAAILENLYLPPRQDFRIVVISDLNSQYGATEYEPEVEQAIALIPYWQPDLVLCGGDMIAGQKASLTKSEIESMWAAFDRYVAKPLRKDQIPFGFTIGNHDGSGAIKQDALVFPQERKLAQAYWQQQQLGLNFVDREHFPFYYSFRQNDIFFLVWDASTANISDQQLEWVQQSLTSEVAQSKIKIVIGHLPLYPVAEAKNKPGEYLADGEKLRSLLEQNQVELYLSGHHHAYYPGKKNKLRMLHSGALGQGARALIDSNLPPRKTLTIVDLELATSQLTYTTYDAQTWELIPMAQLPTSIPNSDGKIWRDDIEP